MKKMYEEPFVECIDLSQIFTDPSMDVDSMGMGGGTDENPEMQD